MQLIRDASPTSIGLLAEVRESSYSPGPMGILAEGVGDLGRDDESRCWRWMAKHNRRPEHRTHTTPTRTHIKPQRVQARYSWAWFVERKRIAVLKHHLPGPVFRAMPGVSIYDSHRYYPSDLEAIAGLCEALETLRKAIE